MEKQRILITTRYSDDGLYVSQTYLDALMKHNMEYTIADPFGTYDIHDFDGLVVTGGADVDPRLYHEENEGLCFCEPDYIDETDLRLIDLFYQNKKPILGICRGHQIINVYFNGSLYQDINTAGINPLKDYHLQSKLGLDLDGYCHDVTFVENTKLYQIYGERHQVNSFHHQASHRVGESLTVSAYSDDGLVEASELGDEMISVQWHPEKLTFDTKHDALFEEFYQMCVRHHQ